MSNTPLGKKKKVQLATFSVMTEIWIPYASGCLQAAAKADPLIQENYEFNQLWYKVLSDDELKVVLKTVDVLGLTCYVWNQTYNQHVSKIFKELNPNGIIVWGGPNVPNEPDAEYLNKHSSVDFFIFGQAEIVFAQLLKYISQQGDAPKSQMIINGQHGRIQKPTVVLSNPQVDILDQFVSPYLTDEFSHIYAAESYITAVLESNRGCPFKCAFCDWGGQSQSKVVYIKSETTQDVLNQIFSKKNIKKLVLTDANFGLRVNDLHLVDYMIGLKEKYNHSPDLVYGGLVKNGSPFLKEILHKIHAQLSIDDKNLKLSFQTHTPEVLKIIERKNISNEKTFQLASSLCDQKIYLTSEMIIALPGETAKSWLKTLVKDFSLGIRYMRAYNLMVLPNTLIKDGAYQEQFGIKTKKVHFPYQFSGLSLRHLYLQELNQSRFRKISPVQSFETYELIYQNFSYDLKELKRMHGYHWIYHNFINTNLLRDFFSDLSHRGENLEEVIEYFYDQIPNMPFVKSLFDRNQEIVETLFSPEPDTYIEDPELYFFLLRDLRGHDVYRMAVAFETVLQEINYTIVNPLLKGETKDYFSSTLSSIKSLIDAGDSKEIVSRFYSVDARLAM